MTKLIVAFPNFAKAAIKGPADFVKSGNQSCWRLLGSNRRDYLFSGKMTKKFPT